MNTQTEPRYPSDDVIEEIARKILAEGYKHRDMERRFARAVIDEYLRHAPQPAQPQPAWVPMTQALLSEQHPWLYRPMWIAMDGVVLQGCYEWRQGRRPDRLLTDAGDEWAFDAVYVMPIVQPTHPDKVQP